MAFLERCTQKIISKTMDEFVAMEKKFEALEAKMGNVPPKRRYYAAFSGYANFTMFWEREWESLAALEAYQKKVMDDPEWAKASEEASKVFDDVHNELFYLIPFPE